MYIPPADRASGIRLKFTVMVPEDDHNNTVWVGGSMLASTGALDGEMRWNCGMGGLICLGDL